LSTSAPSEIAVTPVGHTSALAWLVPATGGVELTIVGKIVVALGFDGQVEMVGTPELPGWNQERPAPEEVDRDAVRKIMVRGRRAYPGKVVLRRGAQVLVECPFGPGDQSVETPLANNMQTTIAGKRGDEWLVVEGGDGAEVRRWCKLPKLGLVATWSDVERLVLTSRICFVDVSNWTIAFLLRGSRRLLPTMAPRHLSVAVHDLAGGAPLPVRSLAQTGPSPRAPAVTGPPAPTPMPHGPPPSPFVQRKGAFLTDDTTTGIRLTDDDFFVSEAPTTPLARKNAPPPPPAVHGSATDDDPPEPQPATRIFSYEDAMKHAGLATGLKEEQTVFADDVRALVPPRAFKNEPTPTPASPRLKNEPTPAPASPRQFKNEPTPAPPFRAPEPRRSNGSGLRLGRGSGVMPAVQEELPSLDDAFDMLEGKAPKK